MLHYALNEGGLLFLGTRDHGEFSDLFATVDANGDLPVLAKRKPFKPNFPVSRGVRGRRSKTTGTHALSGPSAERLLLLEALPPSVLVDRNYQVLHSRRYQQVPADVRR